MFIQTRKQLNNRSTKRQCFHPIWSKKLTFSHITSYTRNSTQQAAPQRPIFTTDDSTHYQQKHTLKIAPVALHNHINNLFSGITKQLNNTYAIPKNNQPLYGRLPDNQPNFHRQSENIHTHDTPFPKQQRNTRITETSTKPVTARILSIPKDTKHNNHGKRITQYTNNYKSLSHALQTNNSNTITKAIPHLPLLHIRRRTITKTMRTPHRRTTAKRTKPHTPTEKTTHPIHQQK